MKIFILILSIIAIIGYIIIGIVISYYKYRFLKKIYNKNNFLISLIYGILWPIFFESMIPEIREINTLDAMDKSFKFIDDVGKNIIENMEKENALNNINNKEEKVLEINCCPKCGNDDPNEFSINSDTFNTFEGLSKQYKIICNKCNNWTYIKDAKNSSWIK